MSYLGCVRRKGGEEFQPSSEVSEIWFLGNCWRHVILGEQERVKKENEFRGVICIIAAPGCGNFPFELVMANLFMFQK